MRVPEHLREVASYLRHAPRSADGALAFAWAFGLVCAALTCAALALAISLGSIVGPGVTALLGAAGVWWCLRIRRRRRAAQRAWRTAARNLAAELGGRERGTQDLLPWLMAHGPRDVRIADVAYSCMAHAIELPEALVHFEPEGVATETAEPITHVTIFVADRGLVRIDDEIRDRVLASPDALAQLAPLVRENVDRVLASRDAATRLR